MGAVFSRVSSPVTSQQKKREIYRQSAQQWPPLASLALAALSHQRTTAKRAAASWKLQHDGPMRRPNLSKDAVIGLGFPWRCNLSSCGGPQSSVSAASSLLVDPQRDAGPLTAPGFALVDVLKSSCLAAADFVGGWWSASSRVGLVAWLAGRPGEIGTAATRHDRFHWVIGAPPRPALPPSPCRRCRWQDRPSRGALANPGGCRRQAAGKKIDVEGVASVALLLDRQQIEQQRGETAVAQCPGDKVVARTVSSTVHCHGRTRRYLLPLAADPVSPSMQRARS